MLINTGGRTDIAQYYTEWLLNRLEEGYVLSRNPMFPDKVMRYELTPDKVDAMIFCSKNYAPLLPHVKKIIERFSTYFHYTITAYGKEIEPGVPDIETSMETLKQLSELVGRRRVSWRYDPILLTGEYTVERHLETFAYMAEKLAPYIDRCIFSFVEMYKKLEQNMPEIIPMTGEEKKKIARGIGMTAKRYGIHLQTCGMDENYAEYGIHSSACMTLEMLGEANGIRFRNLAHRGIRKGCHCIESRDIGAYDTCMNGCKYCYANQNPQKAFENYQFHDPVSPLLLGNVKKSDEIQQGRQESYLVKKELFEAEYRQLSLFDEKEVENGKIKKK